ncbi:MAG TPA: ATP-binding protein [Acidobacteriota bacterium]|nr:ATP-binding protein [Acidobacteriota bacterium]
MTEEINLLAIIRSEDPLSDKAIQYLIEHKEEDRLVDYKEAFDPVLEKAWLDLNIDVVAFANTYGGFLVLGIKDKTYEIVGLSEEALLKLADIKLLLEKLNRYIQPKLSAVRSKAKEINGKKVVVIFIPQSKYKTHIFVTNADIKHQSGKIETLIKQGTIYVRKTGSNQIVTADDFEELIHRRFLQVKEKMLDGIARVIKAEENQEVVIVSTDKAGGSEKYKVTDASDAIPVKGMSFTITPGTEEEKISAWMALNKGDPDDFPTPKSLIEIYPKRKNLHFTDEHKKWIAYFSLVKGLPAFFYLQNLNRKDIFEILEKASDSERTVDRHYVLDVSAFYGKAIYDKLFNKLSQMRKHASISGYPKDLGSVFKVTKFSNMEVFEEEANNLSAELVLGKDQQKIYRLRKLDCGLYAPF